jgi:hypothetical protein
VPDERGRLFETLEPPRGGLAGLRARIERHSRRRVTLEQLGYASAAVLLLFLVAITMIGPHGSQRDMRHPEFDQARLRLGMSSSPVGALTIPASERATLGARRIPLPTDEVQFYLVASIEPEPQAEE